MSDEGELLEIWNDAVWEVYDPWTAQIRGLFYAESDANLFRDLLLEMKRQNGNYA